MAQATGMIAVVTSPDGPPREALEADGDITVVATVAPGDPMERVLARSDVDTVILEAGRDTSAAQQASRELRHRRPDSRIIMSNAPFDAEVLLDSVEAGVRGYAPSLLSNEALRRLVRAVAGGEVAIPRRLLEGMLDLLGQRRIRREQALRRLWTLSDRERMVLALLTRAQSNDAIGTALHISPQTVRKHVQNVLAKLGVHSRLQAVTFVHRHGLDDQLSA